MNDTGTGAYALYAVNFLDTNTGWAVGGAGRILKTTDGGTTWASQTSGVTADFHCVQFVDANTGWVGGYDGGPVLRKTTNGGASWTSQSASVGTYATLKSVFFLNANTGWAAGGNVVRKTTNGGTNWATQFTTPDTTNIDAVYFVNANTGWIVGGDDYSGRATLFKTTDGGSNWSRQTSGTYSELQSLQFISADTGFAAGSYGSVVQTTNGGATWLDRSKPLVLTSLNFLDANTGWATAYQTTLKTTDGGDSWNASQTTVAGKYLYSSFFVDANTGWAVGDSLLILKTTNGGANWTTQNKSTTANSFVSVYFIDANTGWAVGDYTIFKTTNGGVNWVSQSTGQSTGELRSVYFANANTGWAAGYPNLILKSINGGTTWLQDSTIGTDFSSQSGSSSTFYSLQFMNSNLWVAGTTGKILKAAANPTVSLLGNYPRQKPFKLSKTGGLLEYELPYRTRVTVTLFDPRGRMTLKLFDGVQESGEHRIPMPSEYFAGISLLDFRAANIHRSLLLPPR